LNYKNKPELQERLAAEYALGTLRGAARARFKRWMREDAAIARAVAEWQGRLAPMAASVAERRPPARLWREIEARLSPAAPSRRGFLWKGLGLAAGGAAAAVVVMAVFPALQRPTAGYIALLSDPRTQKPVLIVSARRNDTDLQIRTLDPAIQVADASLELWALPKEGPPASLGLVSARGITALSKRTLPADTKALAVSLEPAGGSPTGAPTGPVLFVGDLTL